MQNNEPEYVAQGRKVILTNAMVDGTLDSKRQKEVYLALSRQLPQLHTVNVY